MITSHNDLSDQDFLKAFENCTFSEELFSHEAHLRFAWLYIQQFGLRKAIMMVPVRIMAYTKSLNKPEIFDMDVTVAAVKLIDHFGQLNPKDDFKQFLKHNPRLTTDLIGLIREFYGNVV